MTIRDVKDRQRFTIPNNKGIWHMKIVLTEEERESVIYKIKTTK